MKTDKNKHNERTKTMKHTCNLQSLSSTYGFLFNSFAQFAMVPTWISQLCSTQILQVEQGRVWKSFLRVFCVFFLFVRSQFKSNRFLSKQNVRIFLLQDSFSPTARRWKKLKFQQQESTKRQKGEFFLHFIGWKAIFFCLDTGISSQMAKHGNRKAHLSQWCFVRNCNHSLSDWRCNTG